MKTLKSVQYLSLSVLLSTTNSYALEQDPYQIIRDHLSQSLEHNKVSSLYGHLMAFETEPDIAGSTFYLDGNTDTALDTYKFPVQRKLFKYNEIQFFGRLGFNYARLKADDALNGGLSDNYIESKWETFSATLGVLSDIPLNKQISLSLGLDAGIGEMENTSQYSGTVAQLLQPALDDILFNWDSKSSIVSGAIGLKHKASYSNLTVDLQAHYLHTYIDSFDESENFSGFHDHSNTFSVTSDITHPLNSQLMGYPLSGIIHLGYTVFMGANRESLDFSQFAELGYSLKFDIRKEDLPLQSFNFGIKAIAGDNKLSGWSILFGYRF